MAILPAYTRSAVLTGQAACFVQPYVPGTPPVLPARTLALGGTWPTPWVPVGATLKGLSFNFKRDVNEIMIEEQRVPIAQLTKKSTFTFELELSEDTFQAMQLAYGGGTITTVAAATGTPGYETFVPSAELTQYSFAFEAENEHGKARRVLVPVVVAVADAKTEYRRSDQQRTYNVSLESLIEIDQCTFESITAAAL